MTRKAIFDAVKAAGGKFPTQTDVMMLDAALDRCGVPRDVPRDYGGPVKPGPKTLAGVIGVAAAAILTPLVIQWEGWEHRAYKDVAGIWTICGGDTYDVKPGQVATEAECKARLERQLIAHAEPVLKCTPSLKDRPYQLATASSLAYNIGVTAYCSSTVDRRFDAGDIKGACDAFLAWRMAGGKEVKGLLNRRKAEREICLKEI